MLVLFIFFLLLSLAVSWKFKSKTKEYAEVPISSNLSGKEIAEKMLYDHRIYDVKVIHTEGRLTDHYNPLDKTVNLSSEVYEGRSVMSAAIAAHECGHAVQHATAYTMLTLRSTLVPVVNIGNTVINIIFILGFFGSFVFRMFPVDAVLLVIIACYALIALFSVITLPVEFDASNRAVVWLNNQGLVRSHEIEKAKDALKWAAMTYVVAALASLSYLFYYVSMFMGGDRD
jgi:Zn-dependent membrane protease YugP